MKKSGLIDANDIDNLLNPKEWLSNLLIEPYLKAVIDQKSTLIVTSEVASLLVTNDGILPEQLKADFKSYEYIIGLILINKNHWNCFYCNIEDSSFVYLDPYGPENARYKKNIAFNNWK